MFKYYVLNYDSNKREVINFNIFRNWPLDEAVQKEVKKYLRAPSKYKVEKERKSGGLITNPETGEYEYVKPEYDYIYGFDAFCEELRRLIMWQEWARCEYEIAVSNIFDIDRIEKQFYEDNSNLSDKDLERFKESFRRIEKIDCYKQCEPNIPVIAREVIHQWKNRHKEDD